MSSITYTTTLEVRRETVERLSVLLAQVRKAKGTRKGTRSLSPFKQAVLVIRWFLDGERVRRLWRDDQISRSTAYAYLDEGIEVLSQQAPDLKAVIEAAREAGVTHLNLDGTVVRTDRVSTPGPNGAGLWWSGKHKHHGGNVQVISTPGGWPLWVSEVRPGREHDTTCAKAAPELLPLLEQAEHAGIPTLTDLGYENLHPALRHPIKKPKGRELTDEHKTYNALIRGVHAPSERANSLLKTTFKAMRRVSLDPWKIGKIARAALVLLHLEQDHTI